MNSKTLIIVIMIISATLGLYIGMNQVSTQKDLENDKKIPSYSDKLQSGDIQNSGDVIVSGDNFENSSVNESSSGDEDITTRK